MKKIWFTAKQKQLLRVLRADNQSALKVLFGIKHNLPLVKVTPNSLHYWTGRMDHGKPVIVADFFSGQDIVAKTLMPVFTKQEIAKEEYQERIISNPYKSFLHFANLEHSKYLPQIYLATDFATGSGDGYLQATDGSWATARGATSGTANDSGTSAEIGGFINAGTYYVRRVFYPTDTSGLGAGAVVSAADLVFYVISLDGAPAGIPAIHAVQTSQASNTSLTANDMDNVAFVSGGSASGETIGSKTISLNATGLTWVVPTGYTKIGLIADNDLNNSTPTLDQEDLLATSENATAENRPKLTITYTVAVSGGAVFFQLL